VSEVVILRRSKNTPLPVEQRVTLVLSVLTREVTMAEAARRHGVAAETLNRWRNRFIEAGRSAMEDGMSGANGRGGSVTERRQRIEIEQLNLALAEATVQLRIWQSGADYVDQIPSPTSRP
jgi:transposase